MIIIGVCVLQPQISAINVNKQFKLMTDKDEFDLKNKLPKTNDLWLDKLLKDKNTVFYTRKEMPPAYQNRGKVYSIFYNIAGKSDLYGNPNREFPWGHAAGTNQSNSFHFINLPSPIITYQSNLKTKRFGIDLTNNDFVTGWIYPIGTVFGEVLLLTHNGVDYPFDLRTRVKTANGWSVNSFRPVITRDELNKLIELPKADVKIEYLKDNQPDHTVFNRKASVDYLPEMLEKDVKRLFRLPFKSALGQEWITYKGIDGYAPTSNHKFSIVPKGYKGAFLSVDSKFCMTCHDGCLIKEAEDFDQKREWYGRIRGSDGIFTFHPFRDVSNEYAGGNRRIFRKELIESGLIK
jgi:hypothetical protein